MNLDIIYKRRSIRRYDTRPVAPELVNELLRAAMSAPSAGNEQPWQFVVITRRDLLDLIPDLHPHAEMTKEAQVAILVCGDLNREKHQGFWVQDCAAAVENMLVAAHAMGLECRRAARFVTASQIQVHFEQRCAWVRTTVGATTLVLMEAMHKATDMTERQLTGSLNY